MFSCESYKVFKNILSFCEILVKKAFWITAWKLSKYGVFSGPYFLLFGLNTEIYFVYLFIQSKCGKTRTRKKSVFDHFSRSEWFPSISETVAANLVSKSFGCRNRYQHIVIEKFQNYFNAIASLELLKRDLSPQ